MSLSHQQKVYIPKEARTNQYITAEIKVTDELLAQYPDYHSCYQTLSRIIFNLAEQHDLRNVHVITNDKLPVVRYHTEAYCFQTAEQILFFLQSRLSRGTKSVHCGQLPRPQTAYCFLSDWR